MMTHRGIVQLAPIHVQALPHQRKINVQERLLARPARAPALPGDGPCIGETQEGIVDAGAASRAVEVTDDEVDRSEIDRCTDLRG